MPIVYGELRELAGHYMLRERSAHTLQPTALVHEAYLRLAGVRDGRFANRVHFYGAAAQAMRRILVDHARQHDTLKRGERPVTISLDQAPDLGANPPLDLIALDDALDRFAAIAPSAAKVVELRYFGGMTIAEVATFLDLSPATVKRYWVTARAWLFRALSTVEP
jgi:RNA polymerase sigma factor (TIGR02999 family)